MKVELVTVFYGEKYLTLFFKSMLPSLWQEGNLPLMLRAGLEITHHVHCPAAEAECLAAYAASAPYEVEIHTQGFTGDPARDRHEALHPCYQQAIERGNLVIVTPADHLFGQGLWRSVKGLRMGEYMVCGHVRLDLERGLNLAEQFLALPHDSENRDLVRFCLDQIPHPLVETGKRGRADYWRTFRRGDHWETYFCSPPPLAFIGTPDMILPWKTWRLLYGPLEVIDHDLVDHCFKLNRLRWVDDSREFFWGEWTSNQQYTPTINTNLPLGSCHFFHGHPLKWYV